MTSYISRHYLTNPMKITKKKVTIHFQIEAKEVSTVKITLTIQGRKKSQPFEFLSYSNFYIFIQCCYIR